MRGCKLRWPGVHSLQQHHWYHRRYHRAAGRGSYTSHRCQHDLHCTSNNHGHDHNYDDTVPWIANEHVAATGLLEWQPRFVADDFYCIHDQRKLDRPSVELHCVADTAAIRWADSIGLELKHLSIGRLTSVPICILRRHGSLVLISRWCLLRDPIISLIRANIHFCGYCPISTKRCIQSVSRFKLIASRYFELIKLSDCTVYQLWWTVQLHCTTSVAKYGRKHFRHGLYSSPVQRAWCWLSQHPRVRECLGQRAFIFTGNADDGSAKSANDVEWRNGSRVPARSNDVPDLPNGHQWSHFLRPNSRHVWFIERWRFVGGFTRRNTIVERSYQPSQRQCGRLVTDWFCSGIVSRERGCVVVQCSYQSIQRQCRYLVASKHLYGNAQQQRRRKLHSDKPQPFSDSNAMPSL